MCIFYTNAAHIRLNLQIKREYCTGSRAQGHVPADNCLIFKPRIVTVLKHTSRKVKIDSCKNNKLAILTIL